jgi:hypothetical protein
MLKPINNSVSSSQPCFSKDCWLHGMMEAMLLTLLVLKDVVVNSLVP